MPPLAFVLIVCSALMHAGWNLLLKRANNKEVFMWWALLLGTLLYSPLLLRALPISSRVWFFAVASALLEIVYFLLLARAYALYEVSLIYPISRGCAPALLALWAVLFLQESLRLFGVIGIALVLAGVLLIGNGGLRHCKLLGKGVLAAFALAGCISSYSIIDAAAVRLMPAAPYTVLIIGLTGLFFTPIILHKHGKHAVQMEWRKQWRAILVVAILHMLAYLLVLQVYATSRVSYAGALREISVVFAALAGWLWQGESFGKIRTLGAALIFIGILVMTLAK